MATKGDISDLDTLMFEGEPMVPLLDYAIAQQSGVSPSTVGGGNTRQRKRYFSQPHRVNASFFLDNQNHQDYVRSFFRKNEGKYFICHTAADRPIVEPYVVQVIGSAKFGYTSKADGLVSVNLEIVTAPDQCMDDYILTVSPCYSGCLPSDVNDVIGALA
jgi:hypothetical protein